MINVNSIYYLIFEAFGIIFWLYRYSVIIKECHEEEKQDIEESKKLHSKYAKKVAFFGSLTIIALLSYAGQVMNFIQKVR